jgi:phosphohistidine phosphatase
MKLYLVRHGEASPRASDSQSPLSEKGTLEVKRLADFLAKIPVTISFIFHSEKLRAKQTAEILAAGIQFSGAMEQRSDLNPMDSVLPIANEMKQASQDIMLVGHMPFMGMLAAKLVTGNENSDIVIFQTATLVGLERISYSQWIIADVIRPVWLSSSL